VDEIRVQCKAHNTLMLEIKGRLNIVLQLALKDSGTVVVETHLCDTFFIYMGY
jgi:hypothetical protein